MRNKDFGVSAVKFNFVLSYSNGKLRPRTGHEGFLLVEITFSNFSICHALQSCNCYNCTQRKFFSGSNFEPSVLFRSSTCHGER